MWRSYSTCCPCLNLVPIVFTLMFFSVVGAAAFLALAGFIFNMVRGKRGLNAVPGLEAIKNSVSQNLRPYKAFSTEEHL